MIDTTETWGIQWERDKFDSAESTLRIIDASPESLSHQQGPTVWANLNVRAVAPHVEEIQRRALLMKAAPQMLEALRLMEKAYVALLPGAAHLAVDIGLLNEAGLATERAIRAATVWDFED